MGLCMGGLNFGFSYTFTFPSGHSRSRSTAVFTALYCVETQLLKYAVGPSYISRLAQKKTSFKLEGTSIY